MKSTLHKNELVLSADDDHHERIFLQLIGNQKYVYKVDYKGQVNHLIFEYCSQTRSLKITRELQSYEKERGERE